MNKRYKKAMSLAEICVVLAVISIAALMVASFTVMVGARASVSAAKLSTMQDLELTETVLSNWVTRMAIEDAEVSVDENGIFSAVKGSNVYAVKLEDGALVASLPNDRTVTIPVSTVTSVSVEMLQSEDDTIYFCTVTHPDPRGGEEEQTYTFCINTRIGEKVESGKLWIVY